jgi:S-layer protein (TIGR01567 family)
LRILCRILPAILLALLLMSTSAQALEIRGTVYDLGTPEVVWTPQNFPGFYYDIDKDLGAELLTIRLTRANAYTATLSDQPDFSTGSRGIVYRANMQHVAALSGAKNGSTYGKLRVKEIDSASGMLVLDNEDNQITLSRNKKIELMPGLWIGTANQENISDENPLRFYVYKEVTEPGTYEIRGEVAKPGMNQFTWAPENFAGFYYDIDKNIGRESLTIVPTTSDGTNFTLIDYVDPNGMRGITYRTIAQPRNFKFKSWGQYYEIGFLTERYFAGYSDAITQWLMNIGELYPYLYDRSRNRNLMTNEQLSKVLIDDDTTKLVKKGEAIKLKEGYELVIKGINGEGQVYLQLLRNGQIVDEAFIAPSIDNAKMADRTYCYRKDLDDLKDIVIIAVHFRSTYKDEEQAVAAVDGIWQISDTPAPITTDLQYDKMSIRMVDPTTMTITMDNKDHPIDLTRRVDVELMPSLHLRTAENETLRYYIYKTESIS